MKVISRKSELEINGTKKLVDDVISSLKDLPSKEVVKFFDDRQKNMPRKVRMNALHMVLDKRVKKAEFKETLTDEMNYRLKWLNTFSEHQLEGVLTLISNAEIYNEYRENLWLLFLKLHEELKIDTQSLFDLYELSRGYKMLPKESITEYQRGMDVLFYDEKKEVDGLEYETFREVLMSSSTLNELREIGAKYAIDVPRRIKKNELADIIIDEMSATGQLSQEDQDSIKRMSVMALQRYAKNNNIKASIELKKEDIIEYIIARVETEIQKSYVNLAILDISTEDDVVDEIVEEEKPVKSKVAKKDDAIKGEIDDLKAQISMLVQMQQQQIVGANDKKNEEENRKLEEEKARIAEEAKKEAEAKLEEEKARIAEEARKEAEAKLEEEKARIAEEARIEAEAKLEEEKARIAEEARMAAEAKLAEEKARIAEEARMAAEAKLAEEKETEMTSIREENEILKQEMTGMRQSSELEGDEFVIPVFDYEETYSPAEPQIEETVEEEILEELPLEETDFADEGLITMEDIADSENISVVDDMMVTLDMEDVLQDDGGGLPSLNDFSGVDFSSIDEPTSTKIEEQELFDTSKPELDERFEAPTYDDGFGDDSYGDFDTPLFDTPIFEAPVFEAPIYGEDREARNRRLSNETRVDKKRRAAEEKAIQEALRADSKIAKRKTKSNIFVRILLWLLLLIIIAVILIIVVGILGARGVFKTDSFFFDFYINLKNGIAKALDVFGFDVTKSVYPTIKGWIK